MKALMRPLMATNNASQTIYAEAWKATNRYAMGDLSNHVLAISYHACHHTDAEVQIWPTLEHEARVHAKTALSSRVSNAKVR